MSEDKKFSKKDMVTSYQEGREDGLNDMATFLMQLQKDSPNMSSNDLVMSAFAFKEAIKTALNA